MSNQVIHSLVSKLNSIIAPQAVTVTPSNKTSLISGFVARKAGNVVAINGVIQIGNDGLLGSGDLVCTLSDNAKPLANQSLHIEATYNGAPGWYTFQLNTSGELYTATGGATFNANSQIILDSIVYII